MSFTITVLNHPASSVVEIAGELDLAAAPTLRMVITRELDEDLRDLELDLSALTFMDAAGIQALTRAQAEAVVRGARLEVTAWGGALDRVAVTRTAARALVREVRAADA